MAGLIVSHDIEPGSKTAVNKLAIKPDMIKITVQNKYCAPGFRHPVIMRHDAMSARLKATLLVYNARMLYPEIKTVKPTIFLGLRHNALLAFRFKYTDLRDQRCPVPAGNIYGIRFPVHVELSACHLHGKLEGSPMAQGTLSAAPDSCPQVSIFGRCHGTYHPFIRR